MSSLSKRQLRELAKEFKADTGYVLNFNHTSLEDFVFEITGLELDDEKYITTGKSMGKKLMEFLRIENDEIVSKLIQALRQL